MRTLLWGSFVKCLRGLFYSISKADLVILAENWTKWVKVKNKGQSEGERRGIKEMVVEWIVGVITNQKHLAEKWCQVVPIAIAWFPYSYNMFCP